MARRRAPWPAMVRLDGPPWGHVRAERLYSTHSTSQCMVALCSHAWQYCLIGRVLQGCCDAAHPWQQAQCLGYGAIAVGGGPTSMRIQVVMKAITAGHNMRLLPLKDPYRQPSDERSRQGFTAASTPRPARGRREGLQEEGSTAVLPQHLAAEYTRIRIASRRGASTRDAHK